MSNRQTPIPPMAKAIPYPFIVQGRTLVDDYAWLENKDDPEVIAYLEAENAYAEAVLQHTAGLQEQLFREMVGRIQEDDASVPEKRGEYFYFWRIAKGQQYKVFFRQPVHDGGASVAPEQMVLDQNALAQGQPYCQVQVFAPSPDNRLLAYSVDTSGARVFDLYVKDLHSGEVLAGPIPQTAWTAAWASDSRTLFYTVFDKSHRSYQLYRIKIGAEIPSASPQNRASEDADLIKGHRIPSASPQNQGSEDAGLINHVLFPSASPLKEASEDVMMADAGEITNRGVLVYHEPDDAFLIHIRRTRSGAYLLLTIFSATTSEVRFLPAAQPEGEFRLIEPRRHWVEYYVEHRNGVEHHGDHFLIRTNDQGAENFKLVEAPVTHPAKEHWQEVLPHRADTLLEGVDAFQDVLVLYERQGGLQRMRISRPDGVSGVSYVDFPDPVYAFTPGENPEFDAPRLRLEYSSLVTPHSIVDYDLQRKTWEVRKVQAIPSGYDPAQYTSERLFATASDGAQVPISLVYRRGLPRDGKNPLLLEGYGSYGFSYDPEFDARRLSLLERGFAFAIAHVRGGSELGRRWYENGRLMHKKNTFTDFIACAERLVAEGYTSPDRLAIHGASAGGLLVSAVTNLRPDLFKAVIARVPFTNVITAMLDPNLPLTVIEWEQWGDPQDPQAFEYMLSYSPYENVEKKAYPHILVKGGLNDLQVPYWDPAKWTAKLRLCKTDGNLLLLVTNMGAGHSGASGRYDHLLEDAQMYAFLVETVGDEKPTFGQ